MLKFLLWQIPLWKITMQHKNENISEAHDLQQGKIVRKTSKIENA